jgi:hypothetical protein
MTHIRESLPNAFQRKFLQLWPAVQQGLIRQWTSMQDLRIRSTESTFWDKYQSIQDATFTNYFKHRSEVDFLKVKQHLHLGFTGLGQVLNAGWRKWKPEYLTEELPIGNLLKRN